ncbi:MAG: acyl-CoA dehydrogenase [Mycobacterium sp.]|nr:acyl-CoA dehydrogenase [Mycobacterium sp.]
MSFCPDAGRDGLSQVQYNKALMLVGSVHPSAGALLSAHQSMGFHTDLDVWDRGKDAKVSARCTREISAFRLAEPDAGSDRARLHATATPVGNDCVLNGSSCVPPAA